MSSVQAGIESQGQYEKSPLRAQRCHSTNVFSNTVAQDLPGMQSTTERRSAKMFSHEPKGRDCSTPSPDWITTAQKHFGLHCYPLGWGGSPG